MLYLHVLNGSFIAPFAGPLPLTKAFWNYRPHIIVTNKK